MIRIQATNDIEDQEKQKSNRCLQDYHWKDTRQHFKMTKWDRREKEQSLSRSLLDYNWKGDATVGEVP